MTPKKFTHNGKLVREFVYEDTRQKRYAWVDTDKPIQIPEGFTYIYSCIAYPTRALSYINNKCTAAFY